MAWDSRIETDAAHMWLRDIVEMIGRSIQPLGFATAGRRED